MKELSFKLSDPIQVSKGGGFEDVYELVLTAPSMKDRKHAAKILQFIARAKEKQQGKFVALVGIAELQKMADEAKASGQAEIDVGDDGTEAGIRDVIIASDEDLETFYEAFQTLMLRVCTIDADTFIKQAHIELLSLKDFENLCFEYCENFIK